MDRESASSDKTFSLLRNASFVVLSELLKPFLSFFFIVFLARSVGVEGVGDYTVILTYVSLFEVLATLGLASLIVRQVAVAPEEAGKYLRGVLHIGVVSSLICSVVLLIVLGYLEYPEIITVGIQILCASLIFVVLAQLMQALLEGMQYMGLRSILVAAEVVLRVILGILALWSGYGVLGVVWAIVLTRLLIFGVTLLVLTRAFPVTVTSELDLPFLYDLLRQGVTFLSIILVSIAYWSLDVLMLSAMKGSSDVGIYSSAFRIMDILKNLSFGYIVALFPVMSQSYVQSKSSFAHSCAMSIKYLFIVTFPAALGIAVLSERIIALVYGPDFIAAAITLKILIWTACFFPVMLVFSRALMASGNQKADLWANVFALVVNVLLNLLLIPKYGYIGAAAATVLSIILFLLIQYLAVFYLVIKVDLIPHLVKPFVAGVLMSGFVYICKDYNLVVAIVVPAIAYFGFLVLFRTFTPSELLLLRYVLGRAIGRRP